MTGASTPEPGTPAPGPTGGRRDRLTARFLRAVGHEMGTGELTPAVVSRAVVRVLPVTSAGISTLTSTLRVPLGASSPEAAVAEELQTTLGEGPCLDAAAARSSVVLDAHQLDTRWPVYADMLATRTPFRSVAAVALSVGGQPPFAALDLYSTSPTLSTALNLAEIDADLAAPASALIVTCLEQLHGVHLPDASPEWFETAAGRRHEVWLAIGIVMSSPPARADFALSLLRAHAYSHNRSLDDLAADIVNGVVLPSALTD